MCVVSTVLPILTSCDASQAVLVQSVAEQPRVALCGCSARMHGVLHASWCGTLQNIHVPQRVCPYRTQLHARVSVAPPLQVFPNVTITSTAVKEPSETFTTVVTSAAQLQEAVAAGARHIELQAHLDLTSLQPIDGFLIGSVSAMTRTLRVRPSATQAAASLRSDTAPTLL